MSVSRTGIANDSKKLRWYRLDNAAKVFPAVLSTRITTVFRISVSLNKVIMVANLQRAVENIMPRFPYYNVHLKRGLFWYYFETNPNTPKIHPENKFPCSKISLRSGIFPFRIKAYRNRIAVEFSHMLTDGTGALIFIKALAAEYLTLSGIVLSDWGDLYKKDQIPDEKEYEYAYRSNYRKNVPSPPKIDKAFHIPFDLEKKGIYRIITGIVSSDKIIGIAKGFNVSLSVFLTALLLESIYRLFLDLPASDQKKAIRVLLAVNLRKLYPSITMRNFTLFVTPGIEPRLGEYTFEEILTHTHHYIRMEVNNKLITKQISRNVAGELHPVGRIVPRIIKDVFFSTVYNTLGEYLTTCSLSNIGRVALPDDMMDHVERFDFLPAPSSVAKKHCSVISYKEGMNISFGRMIKETRLEYYFFSKLVELGVPVKIEIN